jgi:integrase
VLEFEDARAFLLDLRERGRSPSTLAQYWSALRFVYVVTLGRRDFVEHVPRPRQVRQPGRIAPTVGEVARILEAALRPFDRAFFTVCYGAGLRTSEALGLRIRDIDTANGLLHVQRGKGGRRRSVHLAPELLEALRAYWREVRPVGDWVFPARRTGGARDLPEWADHPPHATCMQKRMAAAVRAAKLQRNVTLHDLRRAYATHLLEHGEELRTLQVALGHADPATTALYAHVSNEQLRSIPSPLSFL